MGRLVTIGFEGKGFAIVGEFDTGSAMGSPIAGDLYGDVLPRFTS